MQRTYSHCGFLESRLMRAVIGGREKRGAEHYDHGHDYHEHDTGFPSIEGTLMAISFLTFAVYLVRLVMVISRSIMTRSIVNGNQHSSLRITIPLSSYSET